MRPIFLFGFARSGTTLLNMMVGAHPEISAPVSVTGLWFRTEQRLHEFEDMNSPAAVRRLVSELCQNERIQLWRTAFDPEKLSADITPGRYDDVVRAFHETQARVEKKGVWANMDIATLYHLERAIRWFPDALFVHIVRDGRDVALSHLTMDYSEGNILEIALKWSSSLSTALRIGDILGPERMHLMRYEDLVRDPEESLRRLCEFAQAPFESRMLEYTRDVGEKVPSDKRFLWPDLDKPPQANNAYRWRRQMRPSQRYVFEEHASFMLKRLGYECGDVRPFSLHGELVGAWQLIGRGHRVGRALERVGMRRTSVLRRAWAAKASARSA